MHEDGVIDTAVFSWKHQDIGLSPSYAFLWCGSVNYAKRHFKRVILVSDPKGQKLLTRLLPGAFDNVLDLPHFPDELQHVYDTTKILAIQLLAQRGVPVLHIDFDVFKRSPFPERILQAPFAGEFSYSAGEFIHLLNSRLPVPRFPQEKVSQLTPVAGGFFGGNDLSTILEVAERSLWTMQHPANQIVLRTGSEVGYQASVLIGETAFGTAFQGRTEVLFQPDDLTKVWPPSPLPHAFRREGYIHVAGLKQDRGALAQIENTVRRVFPAAYEATGAAWDEMPWGHFSQS